MGFVLEGELINSYQDETKKGKAFTVYQVSYKAGKQVVTVNIKDYYNHGLGNGPCRVSVFPDVWVSKTGNAVVSWVASKDQGAAVSGSGGRRPAAVAV